MKKKSALILTSILVGAALLFTTAFASMSGTSGYDTYKEALKNMQNVKNATVGVTVSVTDNDKNIVNVKADAKADKTSKKMSSSDSITAGGVTKTVETYSEEGKTVVKSSDSDTYNVITNTNEKRAEEMQKKMEERRSKNPEMEKDVEKVVDALVGNVQNYISVNNSGDNKEVALSMSGEQISPTVNAIASLMIKSMEREGTREASKVAVSETNNNGIDLNLKKNIANDFPKLNEDIRISSVNLKAVINKDNVIESQTAVITVTGKDTDGKDHSVVVNASMNLSDLNNTKPASIDLTGKKVKEIKAQEFKGHEGHRK